jgi:hypothetical protein
MPTPVVVSHVPVVSAGIVTVTSCQVFAAAMVNVNGYARLVAELRSDPEKFPVKLERTQMLRVTLCVLAAMPN